MNRGDVMIYDTLNNCDLYNEMHINFERAFDFIKKAVKDSLPVGKYEIDGDNLFANIQEYSTKLEEECQLEGHRKYIDIQYIVSGVEVMGVINKSKINSDVNYDENADVQFFLNSKKESKVVVEEGEYCIFMPSDIHKPGMAFDMEMSKVKKIVVKVKK